MTQFTPSALRERADRAWGTAVCASVSAFEFCSFVRNPERHRPTFGDSALRCVFSPFFVLKPPRHIVSMQRHEARLPSGPNNSSCFRFPAAVARFRYCGRCCKKNQCKFTA